MNLLAWISRRTEETGAFLKWLRGAPEKYLILAIVLGVIGLLWWVASLLVSWVGGSAAAAIILGVILVWIIAFFAYIRRNT